MTKSWMSALLCALCLMGCDQTSSDRGKLESRDLENLLPSKDPYPSTYRPYPSRPTLIRNATVLDGVGGQLLNTSILFVDSRIAAIGTNLEVPDNAVVIDAEGKWVSPGLVDIHSHLGVYPSPSTQSTQDGNELIEANAAHVWVEHSVWPQDPGFTRALAGGVTAVQVLPGSWNLFGGRSVALKTVPARTVQGMKFPGAPYGLKMACGENPKRAYGQERMTAPYTRMGNFAVYRQGWIEAGRYLRQWTQYAEKIRNGDKVDPPNRDLKLETLAAALAGEIEVHMHCYRADEMALVLDMAKEFGFKVSTFHHATEAYKIADLLAAAGVCSAIWADWWGFKLEAYDAIRENGALIQQAGACVIIHSDSELGIQRLNQEAAKTLGAAQALGLPIERADAIAWITSNPARAMGIYDQTGSLEVGKMADVVVWNRDPFSVYAHAELVFIDGALMYDRSNPKMVPQTDFELGQEHDQDMSGVAP